MAEKVLHLIGDQIVAKALSGVASGSAFVRFRIPSGITETVPDGYQYVVHTSSFVIEGDLVLEGDAELRIYE